MIPNVLKLDNLKERFSNAKLLKRDFTPEAGTGGGNAISGYSPGETIKIRLYGRDLFVDTNRSYLQFTVDHKNTAGTVVSTMVLDGSAYNFIDSIRIYDETSGALLEEFLEYGRTVNKLLRFKLTTDQLNGPYSFSGFDALSYPFIANSNSTTTTTSFYRLPLYGLGLLNMTSEEKKELLPIGLLNRGLRIEIKLIDTPNNIYHWFRLGSGTEQDPYVYPTADNKASFGIKNIKYTANCCQLTGESMVELKNELKASGASMIPFSSYTYKVNKFLNNESGLYYSLNIGAKSLKSVLVVPFQQQYKNNTGAIVEASYKISRKASSNYNNFRNFRATINNQSFPQNPLNGIELISELENALGNDKNSSVSYYDYFLNKALVWDSATDIENYKSDFVAGIDFESLHDSELMTGVNMADSQMPILLQADIDADIYNSTGSTQNYHDFVVASLVDTVGKLDINLGTMEIKF